MYSIAGAIVVALFCAILEEGVTSGAIPYTALYMLVSPLLRCRLLPTDGLRSYTLWLLLHFVLLAIELYELKTNNHHQARKYVSFRSSLQIF